LQGSARVPKQIWLSLTGAVDAIADHKGWWIDHEIQERERLLAAFPKDRPELLPEFAEHVDAILANHRSFWSGASPVGQRELLTALGAGVLIAEGVPVGREPPPPHEPIFAGWWTVTSQTSFEDERWTPRHAESFTIVDFKHSAIHRWGRCVSDKDLFGYYAVRVSVESLQELLHPDPANSTVAPGSLPSQSKNQGGRPRVHDWDQFWIEVVSVANTPDGLPDRDELREHMENFVTGWDRPPDNSAIRAKLSKLYKS
jgi:hypothetical protein